MTISVADLIVTETKDRIYAKELQLAADLGLVTSTWRKGDPTRTTLYTLAVLFELQESYVADFIRGGFLDTAEGDWPYVVAEQTYGVTTEGATFAECLGELVNGGLLTFDFDPGDVVVSAGVGGKTFHNTEVLHLDPGATLVDVAMIADEIGSASSAGAGDVDTMVSSYADVTFTSTTDANGTDLESAESIVTRARLKPAALSPNGAPDAYRYVALSADLTGGADVTDALVLDGPGTVTMYLRNANGPIDPGDVTKVQNACAKWCVPLGITPSISNSTAQIIEIAYQAFVYDSANLSVDEIKAVIRTALGAMFLARPIGGDIISPAAGKLYLSLISGTIEKAHPAIFRVIMLGPTTDTAALSEGHVFVLGGTGDSDIVFVSAP